MASARKRKAGARGKAKKNGKRAKEEAPQAPVDVGRIGWLDLTVADAGKLRDFYRKVIGWSSQPVDMGGYDDFTMHPPGGEPVAGVCNARGANVGLPIAWLPYFTVADLDASVRSVEVHGGRLRSTIRSMGSAGRFCVVEDPAGAVCALFQSAGS
jgi:predicted enzyme related to lactoylglutathione lyase